MAAAAAGAAELAATAVGPVIGVAETVAAEEP